MRMDSVGRVEFLLKEIQKAERTEVELWDCLERLAMVRLDGSDDGEPEPRRDWGWDLTHWRKATKRRALNRAWRYIHITPRPEKRH